MLTDLLSLEYIQFRQSCKDWTEALDVVAAPLLRAKKIAPQYVTSIAARINAGAANYIVLREGFALPHARPECGVYESGMSLLKVDEPVYLNDDKKFPLYVIVLLAAVDGLQHLAALSALVACVAEDDDFAHVKEMRRPEQLVAFIGSKSKKD